ncbi:MAG: glycosyltransferase family 1 protein [Clostridia bacterium]|nr:glycosyltransferase family 1 protein [Clostridia bacterium]
MKVGIDARAAIWYRGTGIGTYTYQLIRSLYELKAPGLEYRYFWPGDEYKDLDIRNDSVFNSIEKSKDKFWEEVHIPARLCDENIDIYHVPQNGIGLPVSKQCPVVVTIHDLIPYVYPETVGRGYLKVFLAQMPEIVEKADKIITVSKCSKRDIERILNVPAEKIAITYEAPEPIYKPMDRSISKKLAAEKYGLHKDYILYIGGFSPRKNVKGLISAFKDILPDLKRDVQLALVGKQAREFNELLVLIDALGIEDKVIWTGFAEVEDLPYLYSGAEVFVYPSVYEGFGLPPLEAMACGTPTITTTTSSIPEVVGRSALLVNPFDASQLAEALYKVLTDENLRQGLSEKGLKRAGRFTWRKTAEGTLEIYRELAGIKSYQAKIC